MIETSGSWTVLSWHQAGGWAIIFYQRILISVLRGCRDVVDKLDISESLYATFKKLDKKNKKQLKIINKKVNQILKDPHHFKPLRGDMKGSRRVHIDKSFVLVYEIDEKNKIIRLLDYDHHDKVYG